MRPSKGSRTSQSSVGKTKDGPNSLSDNSNKTNKKSAKEKNKDMVDIQPIVYSFRVPNNPSPGSIMNAFLPPYWLYHDHAFGVIWMLFHPDKKYIGISQLHWCLRFLLDLKNTEGEYTKDINVCIQAVQDNLIEQYANLGTVLENQSESSSKNEGKDSNKKEKSGVKYEDEKADPENRENENLESGKDLDERDKMSTCSSIDDSGNFSLTYNQMISRGPVPYTEQTPLEQIYKAGGGTKTADLVTSTPEIAALLTSDTSPPDIPLSEMGTEELYNFLNSSRREHVERIKKEIERLQDLEKFMEGLDKQGFQVYIDDDLARRLEQLDGQGIVREADNNFK